MTLNPGEKLGPYEILAPIGKGGMGEVYRARDPRLARDVAIKISNTDFSDRFSREARAIARLNHPHICQIYDVGPNYLVMEFIEGRPLDGPRPPEEAIRLSLQIVSALEDAHAKGILHRDLKPANILVGVRGAKLVDFGVAKEISGSEATQMESMVVGTIPYMAPEQAEGRPADERSEVFSFGSVLYEILCGKRAFENLVAVARDEPAPLQAPDALRSIVARCLSKSPAARYQSMSELKAALEAVAGKTEDRKPSIAVLPFANMSRDADDEYFSDGLTEEIINALVKVPGLKVIARTSAFAFKGQNTDIRKIAETLGVTTVLEGSVRRSGNRIRVTAQLITANDGSHLWSERYDREMVDVFAVQDEISSAISSALQVKLSPAVAARPRYTPNLAAYEALLKAKYFHWKVTFESMDQAKEYYQKAVALDPQYALAHALYADYLYGRTTLGMEPLREVAPLSRALAKRALELDPSIPEAYSTLGILAAFFDHDWEAAESQFAQAQALGFTSPHFHFVYGLVLLGSLRYTEALAQSERALQGDPLQLMMRVVLGMCLISVGRDAEGEEHLRQVLTLDPAFSTSLFFLAQLYAARGRFEEALRAAEQSFAAGPWFPLSVGIYAGLLARAGQTGRASELLKGLGNTEAFLVPQAWGLYHVCVNEIGKAADRFEKAIEQRDPYLPLNLAGPFGHVVRSSPHWPRLAALLNLPVNS
jgi:serine/threonine-protein kinase